jgi:hypothetical protein
MEVGQLMDHNLHLNSSYEVTVQELCQHKLLTMLNACEKPLAKAKDVQARMEDIQQG